MKLLSCTIVYTLNQVELKSQILVSHSVIIFNLTL